MCLRRQRLGSHWGARRASRAPRRARTPTAQESPFPSSGSSSWPGPRSLGLPLCLPARVVIDEIAADRPDAVSRDRVSATEVDASEGRPEPASAVPAVDRTPGADCPDALTRARDIVEPLKGTEGLAPV